MDEDFAFALQLSELANGNITESNLAPSIANKPLSIVDDSWELIDPVPDIRNLFIQFNESYFDGSLACVEVKWSSRMTLCAGLCCYEGRGGLCCIKLSQPLLKLRPRKDLVNTLLHEMIHALLFVTNNNKDHDSHGAEFHKHMNRINQLTGCNITVYHSFHDEVNEYRQHWWKCDGPCAKRRPFYGLVKRSMNRAPSCNDRWWADHQKTCGGVFKKIKEPEKANSKKSGKQITNKNNTTEKSADSKSKKITDFLPKPRDGIVQHGEENKCTFSDSSTITREDNLLLKNKMVSSKVKTLQGIKSDSSNPEIFSGSSKSSTGNIHGFKMTARKNHEPVVNSFSGRGLKISSSSNNTREAFLKRVESDLAEKKKGKRFSSTSNSYIDCCNDGSPKKVFKPLKRTGDLKENNSGNKKEDNFSAKYVKQPVSPVDGSLTASQYTPKKPEVICLDDSADDNLLSAIDAELLKDHTQLVTCPACPAKLPDYELNDHLDVCLA